jgi:uncharacterized integral membrane protein
VIVAAVILLIAQNTAKATVSWAVWDIDVPLVALVLFCMLVAVVLDELIGLVWRRRRRRMLSDRRTTESRTSQPPRQDREP